MYFVYILKSSQNGTLYIGFTENITRRLREHNDGISPSTKRYIPWKLVYCEIYSNREDAKEREKKIKQFGKVYTQLKRRISRSLKS